MLIEKIYFDVKNTQIIFSINNQLIIGNNGRKPGTFEQLPKKDKLSYVKRLYTISDITIDPNGSQLLFTYWVFNNNDNKNDPDSKPMVIIIQENESGKLTILNQQPIKPKFSMLGYIIAPSFNSDPKIMRLHPKLRNLRDFSDQNAKLIKQILNDYPLYGKKYLDIDFYMSFLNEMYDKPITGNTQVDFHILLDMDDIFNIRQLSRTNFYIKKIVNTLEFTREYFNKYYFIEVKDELIKYQNFLKENKIIIPDINVNNIFLDKHPDDSYINFVVEIISICEKNTDILDNAEGRIVTRKITELLNRIKIRNYLNFYTFFVLFLNKNKMMKEGHVKDLIRFNNVNIVDYIIKINNFLNLHFIDFIENCSLEMVIYIVKDNELNAYQIDEVISNDRVDLFQYFVRQRNDRLDNILNIIFNLGNFKMIKYLHTELGVIYDQRYYLRSIIKGNFEIVNYLEQNFHFHFQKDEEFLFDVIKCGNIDVIKKFYKNFEVTLKPKLSDSYITITYDKYFPYSDDRGCKKDNKCNVNEYSIIIEARKILGIIFYVSEYLDLDILKFIVEELQLYSFFNFGMIQQLINLGNIQIIKYIFENEYLKNILDSGSRGSIFYLSISRKIRKVDYKQIMNLLEIHYGYTAEYTTEHTAAGMVEYMFI